MDGRTRDRERERENKCKIVAAVAVATMLLDYFKAATTAAAAATAVATVVTTNKQRKQTKWRILWGEELSTLAGAGRGGAAGDGNELSCWVECFGS